MIQTICSMLSAIVCLIMLANQVNIIKTEIKGLNFILKQIDDLRKEVESQRKEIDKILYRIDEQPEGTFVDFRHFEERIRNLEEKFK